VRALGPFFFLLLVFPLLTAAQERDPHFVTARIAPAAHRSTFIHGYLHGYEEGFHNGDFDLHMGRISRGDYSHDCKPTGYKKHFGPKRMYEAGFHEGFRVGYADAASGRSFRAIQNVVAANPNENVGDARESAPYDEGVRMGYVAGQQQGLSDARGQHESNPSPACPAISGSNGQVFCAAYATGYSMGYSDGFANQVKTVVAEAK
jgi:hypothetical protein